VAKLPVVKRPAAKLAGGLLPISALMALFVLGPDRKPDEKREPPQRFLLNLHDQVLEVSAGQTFEVMLGDRTYKGRLVAQPTRILRLKSLVFDYPAALSFGYESDDGTETWTLSGRDAVLMLYRFDFPQPDEALLDLFTGSVLESFADSNVLEERATITLAGRTIEGVRLTWDFGGFGNIQEAFVLDPTSPARQVLVLQDTVLPGAGTSAEFTDLRETLERTYLWKVQ
jgi:hypothetical protein